MTETTMYCRNAVLAPVSTVMAVVIYIALAISPVNGSSSDLAACNILGISGTPEFVPKDLRNPRNGLGLNAFIISASGQH